MRPGRGAAVTGCECRKKTRLKCNRDFGYGYRGDWAENAVETKLGYSSDWAVSAAETLAVGATVRLRSHYWVSPDMRDKALHFHTCQVVPLYHVVLCSAIF